MALCLWLFQVLYRSISIAIVTKWAHDSIFIILMNIVKSIQCRSFCTKFYTLHVYDKLFVAFFKSVIFGLNRYKLERKVDSNS